MNNIDYEFLVTNQNGDVMFICLAKYEDYEEYENDWTRERKKVSYKQNETRN